MSGKPGRSGGFRAPKAKKTMPVFGFAGTPRAPAMCPRDRCGALVQIHWASDPLAPPTWSCVVGHGGVINDKPVIRVGSNPIPKGTCQRCGLAPVPKKIRRGGFTGVYCEACIRVGRGLLAEEAVL